MDEIDKLADKIIRVEYPTYEQAIPPLRNAIIRKKQQIKLILEEYIKHKVHKLIREIEEEMRGREICAYKVAEYDEGGARFQSGFASGLRHAKYLIKRAFREDGS